MSQPRLIPRKSIVIYSPGSAGLTFAWDATIGGFFKEASLMAKYGTVDTGGYLSVGPQTEKLDPTHSFKIDAYHSRLFSAFSSKMFAEMNQPDPTYWMLCYQGAVAGGVDNPWFRVAIQMTDLGAFGGAKNTPSQMTPTLPIEGQIWISTSTTVAGTPPADGSFSVLC